jgi:hypothetical protein
MTQSALVLGSEEFGNEPLHKIRYGALHSLQTALSGFLPSYEMSKWDKR